MFWWLMKKKKNIFDCELVEWPLICRDLYQHRWMGGPDATPDAKNSHFLRSGPQEATLVMNKNKNKATSRTNVAQFQLCWQKVFVTLYNSMVRTHLEYSSSICITPHMETNREDIINAYKYKLKYNFYHAKPITTEEKDEMRRGHVPELRKLCCRTERILY